MESLSWFVASKVLGVSFEDITGHGTPKNRKTKSVCTVEYFSTREKSHDRARSRTCNLLISWQRLYHWAKRPDRLLCFLAAKGLFSERTVYCSRNELRYQLCDFLSPAALLEHVFCADQQMTQLIIPTLLLIGNVVTEWSGDSVFDS